MSSFETAFSAWIIFISNLGVNIEPLLLPPASQGEIIRIEKKIGYELPDDFTNLYLTANGQLIPYWDNKDFTGTHSPVFGNYEFMSLEKALTEYQQQLEWYQEELPSIFEAEVKEGDPVAAVAWQPGWMPFAVSNAAYYAVDLSPIRGGTYGQVIEYGHDTIENRVMAPSISEFLTLATKMLDPNESNRYAFELANPEDPHGRNFSTLFFDMDWRQAPEEYLEPEYYPDPEMDEWNAAHHSAVDSFLTWLEGKGFDEKERDTFSRWTFEMFMPMSMQQGLLSPPMPGTSVFSSMSSDPMNSLISLEMALRYQTNYIIEELPVTLEEAFTLLHRYRVETGEWSQKRFDAAASIIQRERPPRSSMSDENATASLMSSSVVSQFDGSRLLCMESYSDTGEITKECIRFSSDNFK